MGELGEMGIVTLVVLGFTGVCLFLGIVLGLIRGAKRSLLRFFIVALCGVAAFFLRTMFVEQVKGINVGGKTIAETIEGFLSSGEVPESVANVIKSLVDIIISLGCYLVIFLALQLVTWMIIFPILKGIFFGSDRRLRERGEKVSAHRFIGMIIGIIQGALVAFLIVAPVNGLLVTANELSKVEMDGEPVITLPENLDLDGYSESVACKGYTLIGDWYFKMLTSDKDVSLSDTTDAVVAGFEFASEVTAVMNAMDDISLTDGVSAEDANAIRESLYAIDETIDNLSDGARALLEDLIPELAEAMAGDGVNDISHYIPEDFSFDDFDFSALGDAIVVIAGANGEEELDSEGAATIINALTSNEILVNIMSDATTAGVAAGLDAESRANLDAALNASDASTELKTKMHNLLFGV